MLPVDCANPWHKSVWMNNTELTGLLPSAVHNRDCGKLAPYQFLFEKGVKIKRDDASHVAFTALDQICNTLQRRSSTWCLTLSIELRSEFIEKVSFPVNRLSSTFLLRSLSRVLLNNSR